MSVNRQNICSLEGSSHKDVNEELDCDGSAEEMSENACQSARHSTDTLESSGQDSFVSSVSQIKISDITLDRDSYICMHQGPNVVSSSESEPKESAQSSPLLSNSHNVEIKISETESLLTSPGSSASYSRLNDSSGIMCRICHCGEEDEDLMITCRCMGTVKYAHQNCVLNWISKSGNQYCELCKYKYKTRRKKIKSLWKWKFPSVSTKGWLHIGLFIAFVTMLLTSITWIVWSRVSSTPTAVAERTTDEVKFAYMLNGLFIALAIGGLYFDSYRHVKRYFQRWSVLNRHMIIEPYCKPGTGDAAGSDGKAVAQTTVRPVSSNSIAVELRENEDIQPAGKKSTKKNKGTWV